MEQQIIFLVPTLGERVFEINRLLDSLETQTRMDFRVVIVCQGNIENIQESIDLYNKKIPISVIQDTRKGLSCARNLGLEKCIGSIVVLSDDDCWYPQNTVDFIYNNFNNIECDILLSQIYDKINEIPYKNYSKNKGFVKHKYKLLSKSSIEIAFKYSGDVQFDELFGLGAKYKCCEEVDFLIQMLKKHKRILYIPEITVFHEKKNRGIQIDNIKAKGALYCKNFCFLFSIAVLIRDLLIKHTNNFKLFFEGYYDYEKNYKGIS